ncbi:MAG: hypothetical protein EOO14_18930 [Chitinophagaceae bacterium]|nr:MAG: hypothetical protein EOO14_18930 [Chitinophagaceae bacterium]
MKLSTEYQVVYNVDDRTLGRYRTGGIDLLKANGQRSAMLPVPAVYIINTEGTITYRYFNENYRTRVSVQEILKNLPR